MTQIPPVLVPDWPAEVAPTLGTGWADRHPGSQNQDWVAQKGGLFVPDTAPLAFGGNNTSGPIDVAAGLNAKGGSGRMDFETETFLAFTQNQRDEVRDLGGVAGALAAEPGSHQQNYVAFDMQQVTSVANRQRMESGRPAPTLHQSGGAHAITPAMAVRRLLPVECCRLQGFPDTWLDDLGLADSSKYRMLGNAVCVNVAEWLARRIVGAA